MKHNARNRRMKHSRKIAACERKFPVYGLSEINNPATVDRLQKMGIISEDHMTKDSGKGTAHQQFNLSHLFDDIE